MGGTTLKAKPKLSKGTLLTFLVLFAIIGGYFIFRSFAATTPIPATGIFRFGSSYSIGSGYDRYSYVTVGIGDASKAGALNTNSLVYMSGTSLRDDWGYPDTGVPLSDARANNWVLKKADGSELMNTAYNAPVADFANSAYQQKWIDNVSGFLMQNKNEGVYIDDVICDAKLLTGGFYPTKYPDRASWQNAMVSFVTAIGNGMRAKGFYVLVNANCYIAGDSKSNTGENTKNFWKLLAPYVSGLGAEYWQQKSVAPRTVFSTGGDDWTHFWDGWQGLVDVAQSAGADFFADNYAYLNDFETQRYLKASFLMEWDGGGGALLLNPEDNGGNADPYSAEWTIDIGTPIAAKYAVGTGFRREYSKGTAIINPWPYASQTFNLGATYKDLAGNSYTTITLAPTTAIILISTTSTPPPALPTVSLTANPTTITSGQSSTVTWSTTNATSCSATGGWTSSTATSGSQVVSPTTTTTYTLSCTGTGGTTTQSTTVTVNAVVAGAPTWTDIASGKTATASSIESSAYDAPKANDNNSTTRWSSSPADNQWWQVDLGANYSVSSVALNWEYATASSYKIQTSTNATTWTDVASKTGNTATGWIETPFTTTTARYVRVNGITRATAYGFSFWDAWVKGTPATTTKPGDLNNDNQVNITDLSILLSNYGTTNTVADINKDGTVNITDLSILLSNYGT